MPSDLTTEVHSHLASKGLAPTQSWLQAFISTQKSSVPLTATKQTALFRLLASDIAKSVQHTGPNTFPHDILNAEIIERHVPGPVPVQILDVEDIGSSRWSQIEAIEAIERGETTRGQEVIRLVDEDGSARRTDFASSRGPHKLLLQDARGVCVYAFEYQPVEGINIAMSIGSKLVLKHARVSRGVVMLDPASTSALGGKIESLHTAWRSGRKARLKASITSDS